MCGFWNASAAATVESKRDGGGKGPNAGCLALAPSEAAQAVQEDQLRARHPLRSCHDCDPQASCLLQGPRSFHQGVHVARCHAGPAGGDGGLHRILRGGRQRGGKHAGEALPGNCATCQMCALEVHTCLYRPNHVAIPFVLRPPRVVIARFGTDTAPA
eukprot:15430291-Alexandrium_andersonii.AAC.1